MRGDSLKLPVKASNLGGEPLTASGEARIVRLRALAASSKQDLERARPPVHEPGTAIGAIS